MEKKSKNKFAIIIYQSVFAMLALVVVSYAWFVYTNEVGTTGIGLNVENAINVAISEDATNWGHSIEILVDGEQKVSELSGDGRNLFYPIIESGNVINGYRTVEGTMAETHFIEFTVYIKTDGPLSLYLGPGSYVQPLSNSSLKDNIVGAVRVACFDANSSSDAIVWAPNSTYHYSNGSVNKSGTVESSYTYATSTSTTKTILTNGQESGVSEDKTFIWGDITEQTYHLLKPFLTVSSPEREETINEIVVRVWIEGNDREAERALIGGKFRIFLNMKAGHAYEE